jgi:hypothetical protein
MANLFNRKGKSRTNGEANMKGKKLKKRRNKWPQ